MGVPKNFLKNINIKPVARNHERREQLWQEGMNASGTFVPKGVLYEDMDRETAHCGSKRGFIKVL